MKMIVYEDGVEFNARDAVVDVADKGEVDVELNVRWGMDFDEIESILKYVSKKTDWKFCLERGSDRITVSHGDVDWYLPLCTAKWYLSLFGGKAHLYTRINSYKWSVEAFTTYPSLEHIMQGSRCYD